MNKTFLGIFLASVFIPFTAYSGENLGQDTNPPTEQPGDSAGPDDSGEDQLPEYPAPDRSTVATFPGAEGAGRLTSSGAGETVYTVTSLRNDGSEGTLRWTIEKPGERTIVFVVGGVIPLSKQLQIKNDDIAVAGQTAPHPGICLKNYILRVDANNVIIRFIRSHMRNEYKMENDSMNRYQNSYPGKRNAVIDHCSISWSTDECASFCGNTDFAMQWCIISESLTNSFRNKEDHGYDGMWGGSPTTFHHNLLAYHSNHTPRLCGSRYSNREDMKKIDLCSNIIYNWTSEGAYAGEGGSYNIMSNYYKSGPVNAIAKVHCRIFTAYLDDGKNQQAKGVYGRFCINGNYFKTHEKLSDSQKTELADANADNTSSTAFCVKNNEVSTKDLLVSSCFPILDDYSFVQSAQDVYQSVLLYAGVSNLRDHIGERIAKGTQKDTCAYTGSSGETNGLTDTQVDVEGWSEYASTTSTQQDDDKDGIPDEWETANGLNPNDSSDGNKYNLNKEYTNLEVYLNSSVNSLHPTDN